MSAETINLDGLSEKEKLDIMQVNGSSQITHSKQWPPVDRAIVMCVKAVDHSLGVNKPEAILTQHELKKYPPSLQPGGHLFILSFLDTAT